MLCGKHGYISIWEKKIYQYEESVALDMRKEYNMIQVLFHWEIVSTTFLFKVTDYFDVKLSQATKMSHLLLCITDASSVTANCKIL